MLRNCLKLIIIMYGSNCSLLRLYFVGMWLLVANSPSEKLDAYSNNSGSINGYPKYSNALIDYPHPSIYRSGH